jgi:UDP-2,3-diacylglucosamine hydrolase
MADSRAHEARVVGFLQRIAPTARRLYLVGDVLDYWFEYRHVVPKGHVRFLAALAALADSGVEVVWYAGNHDIWLFGYLREELGVDVRDPKPGGEFIDVDGTTFFIGHGDGIGYRSPGFRIIRSLFRNRLCQRLFAAIHPGLTVPLAYRWSNHSRKGYSTPTALDPNVRTSLEIFSRSLATEHPELRYIVIGHHHVPVDEPVAANCRLIVLGDWISRHTYGVFDPADTSFALREYPAGTTLA